MKLWGIVRSDDKIINNSVAESGYADFTRAFDECLTALCYEFDLQKPVILKKHTAELQKFGRTVFRPADFVERVAFDSFEVESIGEKKKDNAPSHLTLLSKDL